MQAYYSVSGSILLILLILAFLLLLFLLHKIMKEDNDLEWWQFISSRGLDGKPNADIDKLGKVIGIFVSSWYIIKVGTDSDPDAAVLGVYLAFVGGIAGYSAYLRAQKGIGVITETSHTETTTSSEKPKAP